MGENMIATKLSDITSKDIRVYFSDKGTYIIKNGNNIITALAVPSAVLQNKNSL